MKGTTIIAAGLAIGSAALVWHVTAHETETTCVGPVSYQVEEIYVPETTITTTSTTTTKATTTTPKATTTTTTVATTTTQTEPISAVPLYDIPLSDDLQEYTYYLCEQYGIVEHYEVVLGMMRTESNFNAGAVSSTGDYGIMQINACNHSWLKSELGIVDIMDARANIECGVYMISDLIHTYPYVDQALMAYNMGPAGAASLWNDGIYTSSYSSKVLGNAELIKTSKK